MPKSNLTSNDIEKAQILLSSNDGQYLLGVCDDPIVIKMIVAYCKFVPVDPGLIEQIPITDLTIGGK